jgi:Putative phage abortive infection protein
MTDLICDTTLDKEKKLMYSDILRARSTSDEIRLIFYFVTFNADDKVKLRLVKRFKYLKFFDVLRDGLIKEDDIDIFRNMKPVT